MNDKYKRSPIQRRALAIVRSEMHLYDKLASRPRIVVEQPKRRDNVDKRSFDKDGCLKTRSCSHDIPLHEPCVDCCRSVEECKVYRDVAMLRIKELLAQLGE